nr:MAG TPA: hypothetical protein [Bacteriophage sp.]
MWYIRFASSTAQTSARKACSFFISVSTFAQAQVEPMVVHTPYGSFHGTNFGTQSVLVFYIRFIVCASAS